MHEYYKQNAPKFKKTMNGLLNPDAKPMEYRPPVFVQGKGYK